MAFKKVENNQKYLKAVIFGESGTGKTTLAEKLAIGLCKSEGKNRVYILDTEGGIEFFADHLQEEGIECFQSDVKFDTYEKFTNELSATLKENPPVLIVDSITSIGELLQKQYVTDGKQSFQQWGKAKEAHKQRVVNLLQNAPFHVIICGRETKGEGDLTDIKIRLGIDIDYELNLLIRTTREMEGENQVRIAHVLKDRTTKIDGRRFKNAKFDDFKPILENLSKKVDSELFKELKNKLLTCTSLEFFDIITESMKEAKEKNEMSEREFTELRKLYIETKAKLPSKQVINDEIPSFEPTNQTEPNNTKPQVNSQAKKPIQSTETKQMVEKTNEVLKDMKEETYQIAKCDTEVAAELQKKGYTKSKYDNCAFYRKVKPIEAITEEEFLRSLGLARQGDGRTYA